LRSKSELIHSRLPSVSGTGLVMIASVSSVFVVMAGLPIANAGVEVDASGTRSNTRRRLPLLSDSNSRSPSAAIPELSPASIENAGGEPGRCAPTTTLQGSAALIGNVRHTQSVRLNSAKNRPSGRNSASWMCSPWRGCCGPGPLASPVSGSVTKKSYGAVGEAGNWFQKRFPDPFVPFTRAL
jgi:hypothetical protein